MLTHWRKPQARRSLVVKEDWQVIEIVMQRGDARRVVFAQRAGVGCSWRLTHHYLRLLVFLHTMLAQRMRFMCWLRACPCFAAQAHAVSEELSWVRQHISALNYRGATPAETR